MYKTRLLRVDRAPRIQQDPLQRSIHRLLRLLRYLKIASSADNGTAESASPARTKARHQWSSQNSSLIAEIVSRTLVAAATALFLTVPLSALSDESRKSVQVAVISTCVVAFACLVSLTLRASNLEMMIVSAAYAAIISAFVSNTPKAK